MPKSREQKQEILNRLSENLDKQKAMVFVEYKGLKVANMASLRNQLKHAGSRLMVAKKTLLSKIMEEKGIGVGLKEMGGQIGAVFAYEDPIAPMKAVYAFGKQNENLKILGGYFEGQMQSEAGIVALATLPTREELLAKLVGTMATPISGFATVLQGNIKGLVYILAQKAKA